MESQVIDRGYRIAVTGARGFLATWLLKRVRQDLPDAHLFGVVRGPAAAPIAGVEYVSTLPAADIIFHLAGSHGIAESFVDPARDAVENTTTTLELLEAARGMEGVRIVLASSVAVYGRAGVVSETDAPCPLSPYAASKRAAEMYVELYGRLHGIHGCVGRIANAYGPGQRRFAVYDLARRAVRDGMLCLRGTGAETRDFVHADDVARGLITIALQGAPGEAYNVASGHPVALREVAELIARVAGLTDEAVHADGVDQPHMIGESRPSIDKLTRLGYRPRVPLSGGIEAAVAWVRTL